MKDKTVIQTEKKDLILLESEIKALEDQLSTARSKYFKKTGQMPARTLKDFNWKWTIFMTLGFAFISCIVYLLGIRHTGNPEDTGIPAFFFSTDIAYFSILTLYVLIAVLIVQFNKISGYQTIVILTGFWCAHWLIYDWVWWAISIGMGETNITGFWTREFSSPLVIIRPPMGLFLVWAILGGLMALYTFSIPRRYRELLPPTLWLYTAYPNASILDAIGLKNDTMLPIGIILIVIAFLIATFYTVKRIASETFYWNRKSIIQKFKIKKLALDPLKMPVLLIMIAMVILMYPFLILVPVIGLFLGFIPWFLTPLFYLLFKGSSIQKRSKILQVLFAAFLVVFFIAVMLAMNSYAL
jgi:hypothetical protein